ncbi:hypothetical protein RSAG8_06008, partial [Rhizoctonia solani AG-8 WAC10335]
MVAGIYAARENEGAYVFGAILHTFGVLGLNSLLRLTIADYTPLRWRALALSFIDFSSIPGVWVDVPIWENLSSGWVWNIRYYHTRDFHTTDHCAIFYGFKAPRRNTPGTNLNDPSDTRRPGKAGPGILMFTIGFGLIDFHMNILWVPYIQREPGQVAMLIIGLVLVVPVFSVWELCYSSHPLMPKWVFQNRGVFCGISAAFCGHLVNTFAWGVVSGQPPYCR